MLLCHKAQPRLPKLMQLCWDIPVGRPGFKQCKLQWMMIRINTHEGVGLMFELFMIYSENIQCSQFCSNMPVEPAAGMAVGRYDLRNWIGGTSIVRTFAESEEAIASLTTDKRKR